MREIYSDAVESPPWKIDESIHWITVLQAADLPCSGVLLMGILDGWVGCGMTSVKKPLYLLTPNKGQITWKATILSFQGPTLILSR